VNQVRPPAQIDSPDGLRYSASFARSHGDRVRIANATARVIFPSRSRVARGDSAGTPVPQTSRRASHSVAAGALLETGALLWVLASRSDRRASAPQQCTIARARLVREKSSTCISQYRMRLGTILDALRDDSPGQVTSAALRAPRLVPQPHSGRREHAHKRMSVGTRKCSAPHGALLATDPAIGGLSHGATRADICAWTYSERHPAPVRRP